VEREKYLGDEDFRPIWKVLHERTAVVFIHPTHPPYSTPSTKALVHPGLPTPVLELTLETTRTALSLVVSGHMRTYPNVKIILPHGGGTLPFLLPRAAAVVSRLPEGFWVKIARGNAEVLFPRLKGGL
jgi:predicted TIM-barrel fold metal-dependent hydrolase